VSGEGADLERKPAGRRQSRGRPKAPRRARTGADQGPSGRAQRRAKLAQDFYGSALDAAERVGLEAASDIEGLDREIALLRLKLREVLSKRPEDLQVMLRGIELLVKAVSARYRLSKEAEEHLAESIDGVVRGVGGLLMPEAFADE
jgi:hypothetical protein